MEQPLLVHGNDGSAQYHVALPGLAPGIYELKASLRLTAAGIAAQQRLQDERNKIGGQGRGYELEEEASGLSEGDLFSSVVSVIEVLEPPSPRQCRKYKSNCFSGTKVQMLTEVVVLSLAVISPKSATAQQKGGGD